MAVMIRVNLKPPYDVHIGRGLIENLHFSEKKIAILVDENVLTLGEKLFSVLSSKNKVISRVLPAGENAKTTKIYVKTLSYLAKNDINRDDAIISIGGGSISDLSGFVAATYLRGISFYIIPTTLLAMDDACVGGKTAINLPEGKNLVGAFHQPRAVFIDLNVLKTLPDNVFRQGVAEIFKHGLLADKEICQIVLDQNLSVDSASLEEIITRSVQIKTGIISKDPLENNKRVYLNLGHTLAHALETATNHQISHGEAVSYGLHYAMHLSKILGYKDLTGLTRKFLIYQRPMSISKLNFSDLIGFMHRDKKIRAGEIEFVLLKDIKRPILQAVREEIQHQAWLNLQKDLQNV